MKVIKIRSIAFKLILGGCLVVLVPIVVLSTYAITHTTDTLLQLGKESALSNAKALARNVDISIKLQEQLASTMAKENEFLEISKSLTHSESDLSKEAITQIRKNIRQKLNALDKNYLGIFITNHNGQIITGELESGKEYVGSNIADRDYFQRAKQTGQTVTSTIIRSKTTQKPIYVVCAPIVSKQGEFQGVLGMSVKASFLTRKVSEFKLGKTGYGYMIDASGRFIAHPNPKLVLDIDIRKLNGMAEMASSMLLGEERVMSYVYNGIPKIAGFSPIVSQNWSVAFCEEQVELLELPRKLQHQVLLFSVLLIVGVSCLIFFFSRKLTKPLYDIVESLKDMVGGGGDLTRRLDVKSRDEVGEMAEWFNLFVAQLQDMIKNVSSNALDIKASTTLLTNISGEVLLSAKDSSERSTNVTAATEEMSTNLNSVAAAMEQSSTSVSVVASAAEEMNATIREISGNSDLAKTFSADAAQQTRVAHDKMGDLAEAAFKIGNVTGIINEISEHTNLLALNATIEAARAGGAGKGFAVVANEIKELAKQTAEATQDIKEVITDVQTVASSVKGDMSNVAEIIVNVNDIVTSIASAVGEQAAATQEISMNVTQSNEGIQEVNAHVISSSSASDVIAADIREVSSLAQNISGKTNSLQQSGNNLDQRSVDLQELVLKFKV